MSKTINNGHSRESSDTVWKLYTVCQLYFALCCYRATLVNCRKEFARVVRAFSKSQLEPPESRSPGSKLVQPTPVPAQTSMSKPKVGSLYWADCVQ
ncbi:hypothetical protein RRG08_038193 [Elysia crispata]|uniref:Uncharacterized protein n=1 Tax=Elysia crispata TaxID=231223 RepID=A0AAE1AP46_9GAST|nr:hypothetical protein RRG08_038193 [Elysia crispata]